MCLGGGREEGLKRFLCTTSPVGPGLHPRPGLPALTAERPQPQRPARQPGAGSGRGQARRSRSPGDQPAPRAGFRLLLAAPSALVGQRLPGRALPSPRPRSEEPGARPEELGGAGR